MGNIIGFWNSLTEAEKLNPDTFIGGVVEEDIKRNNPIERLPVALARGKNIVWNREDYTDESDVADVDIHETLTWTADEKLDQQSVALKRTSVQKILDNFLQDVDATVEDYEIRMMDVLKKKCMRRLGDKLIYDDITYGGSKQFDGLHAMAALQYTSTAANQLLDIDMGETALSLATLRRLISNMKYGVDEIWMPWVLYLRLLNAYNETGFASLATATAGLVRQYVTTMTDNAGMTISRFDGIPIVPTDYLVAENANVGRGSDLRAKYSSGTKVYSIFCVKKGLVMKGNAGLGMGFGNPTMTKDFFQLEYFPQLENVDGKGMRMKTYAAPMLGSSLCLGRIHDITDAAITA